MTPISFKSLLIHLNFDEVAGGAWLATATIENPITGEIAPVALPSIHSSKRDAGMEILAEARTRIRRGTWHN